MPASRSPFRARLSIVLVVVAFGAAALAVPSALAASVYGFPKAGPQRFEVMLSVPGCASETGDATRMGMVLDGHLTAWNSKPPAQVYVTWFTTWYASVGTHRLSFACETLDENGRPKALLWRDEGFDITITEPGRRVRTASATTRPGAAMTVTTGARAGGNPCPSIEGIDWIAVATGALDPRINSHYLNTYRLDDTSWPFGSPAKVPDDIPVGTRLPFGGACSAWLSIGGWRWSYTYWYNDSAPVTVVDPVPLPAPCPAGAPAGDRNCDGKLRVAAIGDSYSSGEGLVPGDGLHYDCATDLKWKSYREDTTAGVGMGWQEGVDCDTRTLSYTKPADLRQRTWVQYENRCHRHSRAYSQRIARALEADGSIFVACSGAVTADVLGEVQHPHSPVNIAGGHSQLKTVKDWADAGGQPDVITVGIGGNDGGFGDIVTHCLTKPCTDDGPEESSWRARRIATISEAVFYNVRRTLQKLRTTFPDAVVLAFGYPSPIGDPAVGDLSAGCSTNGFQLAWLRIEEPERRWLKESVLPALNASVRDAAIEAGVTFVDLSEVMAGNEICTGDRWINGLRGGDDVWGVGAVESVHPNQRAHDAIGAYVLDGSAPRVCGPAEPAQDPRQRTCSYVLDGRVAVDNPAPADSEHLAPSRPIPLGHVDVRPVQQCGADCLQPANWCVQACTTRVQGSSLAPNTPLRVLGTPLGRPVLSELDFRAAPSPPALDDGLPIELGTVATGPEGQLDALVAIPEGLPIGLLQLTLQQETDAGGPTPVGEALVDIREQAPPDPPSTMVAPSVVSVPVIDGLARPGSRLTCTSGVWDGTTPLDLTYTWRTGDTIVGTGPTWFPLAADVGRTVVCSEAAANDGGEATATSEPTTIKAPPPNPPAPGGGGSPGPNTGGGGQPSGGSGNVPRPPVIVPPSGPAPPVPFTPAPVPRPVTSTSETSRRADRTAPRVGILSIRQTKKRRGGLRTVVRFRVTDDFTTASRLKLRCTLDGRPAFRCRSPLSFSPRPGRHRLTIVATDEAGNRASASRTFTKRNAKRR
jgi:lysophospholipase L1-like esterase